MTAINHENNGLTDEVEPTYDVSPDFLLRLKQLGDVGLRMTMDKLKGEQEPHD